MHRYVCIAVSLMIVHPVTIMYEHALYDLSQDSYTCTDCATKICVIALFLCDVPGWGVMPDK